MIIYIVDNKINIIYKNKIISKEFESVQDGYIIHKDKFMSEFLNIQKKEKIRSKLLGDKIDIIKESFYTVSDITFIESIFFDLGFVKVNFRDIKDFFDREATYIEVNKNYLVINLDKGLYLDLNYYKDIPKIIEYFKEFMFRDIIFFGTNKIIANIRIKGFNVYFMDDSVTYITDCLLKVKK